MVAVVIVGPMSSGNRLLRDVIEAGGHSAWIDHSHGTQDLGPGWESAVFVVIRRERWATEASIAVGWGGHEAEISFDASEVGIAVRYPDAPVVWYEDLCHNLDATITKLATQLGVLPWAYDGAVVCQNEIWVQGGGPALNYAGPNRFGRQHERSPPGCEPPADSCVNDPNRPHRTPIQVPGR